MKKKKMFFNNHYHSKLFIYCFWIILFTKPINSFWDFGSTTMGFERTDTFQRTSFFRWQKVESSSKEFWFPQFDFDDMAYRRRLCIVAGMSIDFLPLSTAVILNRRILISSASYFEPYMHRQKDFRIWALGRAGLSNTPYRYRVHKVWRIFPRSLNPEHQHGARSGHTPRHDVAVIISMDQMYIYYRYPTYYMYAYRAVLTAAHDILGEDLWFAGSGFGYLEHIYENYKIYYARARRADVVDCSKYLPKWWGKFICMKNVNSFPGVQNGGGLFYDTTVVGVGCFEIRYNEERILVFTDLRYYVAWINKYANITKGEYYEYAYPQWSIKLGWFYDGNQNYPTIPHWQLRDDLFPLG